MAINKNIYCTFTRLMLIILLTVGQISTCRLSGQSIYLDSLRSALKSSHLSKSERADLLLSIGNHLSIVDSLEARRYFAGARAIAEELKNDYLKANVMSGIGDVFYHYKHFDSALYYYRQAASAFSLSDSKQAKESAAMNKASIANIELHQGNYERAVQTFLSGITLMKKSEADNKWEAIGSLYNGIATAYYDMGQKQKALSYDLKSLSAYKKYHNHQSTAITELTVANDYSLLGHLDSARAHLHAAEKIIKREQLSGLDYKLNVSYGQLYRKLKLPGRAIVYFQRALLYVDRHQGTRFQQMNIRRLLGFAYRDNGRLQTSARYLKKSLALIQELELKKLEAETLQKLGDIYMQLDEKTAAADYYQRFIMLNDSLQASQTEIKINEIENKYQAKQKADSITVLQKNAALQQLALLKKRNQSVFITISATLLLLAGVLLYRNLINKHRLLRKNECLYQQEIKHLKNERQLIAAQSVMKGQEEERSRLAKDLHDGVGGLLSGVKLSLNYMKGNVFLSDKNARDINTVIDQLDISINELRRVSHNMMPEALIRFGLKEAIENYCENLTQAGALKIRFQAYGIDKRLQQQTEIVLFRIVQELLSNIVKHAEAQQVLVQIIRENKKLTLSVEDDGKGFDKSNLDKNTGAGLTNIMARAAYLNCMVDIRTAPGEGTSITIEGDVA